MGGTIEGRGGAVAQLGERFNGIEEVRGSTPLSSTSQIDLRIVMPIPESQLSRWSDHGSQRKAISTHEKIRNVLDNHNWPDGMTREFSLQGSYSSDTNLPGGSDVDVVLELTSTFYADVSELSEWAQQSVLSGLEDAIWTWNDFQRETLKALENGFGKEAVSQGNKTIKVKKATTRLRADVLVCKGYRKYTNTYQFVEGINFYARRDKRWIVNYPSLHVENGAKKSRQTWDRFKRTVRMFKGARNHLESNRQIRPGVAPSYFVECLLYNAPDWMFKTEFQATYSDIVNWMVQNDMSRLMCQNGQVLLFGDSPDQWSLQDAESFGSALVDLWNNWR